jgi:hypothetical protein
MLHNAYLIKRNAHSPLWGVIFDGNSQLISFINSFMQDLAQEVVCSKYATNRQTDKVTCRDLGSHRIQTYSMDDQILWVCKKIMTQGRGGGTSLQWPVPPPPSGTWPPPNGNPLL